MKNFEEVKNLLGQHVAKPGMFKKKYNLDTMRHLLDALGNPQEQYKTVHIAGTSGKTSTAYYMTALLHSVGQKVGLTVSPHIDEVNERVQINLVPLEEAEFCKEFTEFIKLINKLSIKPSYFELLVAFAYWEFARQEVDYAVVETGLGGLLDGTNTISRRDKVCILTDIGFDHAEILGNTLSKIASQKVGIVQAHNAVITYNQDDDIIKVYRMHAARQHAQLVIAEEPNSNEKDDLPLFQQRNYWLALQAFEYVAQRDSLPGIDNHKAKKVQQTRIPARMEEVVHKNKIVIVDGSHNSQKMHALVASFRSKYPETKIPILLSIVSDKQPELRQILQEVRPIAKRIIVTAFASAQDMQKRAIDPQVIKGEADSLGIATLVEPDPKQAFGRLLAEPEHIILVTGSFYLLNSIRPILLEEKRD